MKNNEKEVKISFWASHITTIVSVTLVLLLAGIISMIWISARTESRRLQERLEINVILADSISDARGERFAEELRAKPYAGSVRFVSRSEALKLWTEDTGENLEDMFGVNPLSPEVSFTIKADYAAPETIAKIKRSLEKQPGVENVASPEDEMVKAMNENIGRLTLILGIVGLVMLVISFVLINNTVHLSIYSRRFTIHTMQLVGATNGFIRRPIVFNNMLCGLISGILASGIMALSLWGARNGGLEDIADYVSWEMYAYIAAGMTIAGIILCALAAWMAASKYLRKDYDDLFR